jgi:vancomycin permeability regulator SanA
VATLALNRKLQLIIQRLLLLGSVVLLLFVIPQVWITLTFRPQIFTAIEMVPAQDYAIVFGAQVYADFSLSDVTRERIEAAIQLYEQKQVQKIFISGDNRHNQEAEAIAWYAEQKGVPAQAIVLIGWGLIRMTPAATSPNWLPKPCWSRKNFICHGRCISVSKKAFGSPAWPSIG